LLRSLLLLPLAAALFALAPPRAQQGQLDASETLFTVLAAINAAGYDADLESAANSPVRAQVRGALAQKHLDSVVGLKKFFAAHRQRNPDAELSQYVSFALTLGAPPDFTSRLQPDEIPPDAQKLEGLQPLIVEFYKEAGIAELWTHVQPALDRVITSYHDGATKALLEANAYLRNPTSGARGLRFQIYVDLLGAPNRIQSRSYKEDYFVVVTASPEPQIDEIRHAYLHYLLDPLAIKYAVPLSSLKGLADFAQPAPALEDSYKSDFVLLATECMIKAVESRLARGAQNRAALVNQALREGFVLTPALADGLAVYEKQEESIRFYYPELVSQVDLGKEDKRLERVQFASEATVKKARPAPSPPEPVLSASAKTLAEAEDLYRKRELDPAKQSYRRLLEQPDDAGSHAQAYYGLARIAALERDPELAEKLFQKTLELAPDIETKSWAHLYLGRLADAAGDRAQAEANYRAVLALQGAPATVRAAAEKGLAQPFQRDK
jgi:tetratricopeptide (TPR) repeat protein